VENDEKEGITAIAGVDATGRKSPLTIIGKGKTPMCLNAFNLSPEISPTSSPSGWTTADVIGRYFQLLRECVYPTGTLILSLDTYATHRAVVTKAATKAWAVELVLIPPHCTDRIQPLDRRIFAVSKAHAREIWRTHYHETNGGRTTRSMMAHNLLVSWEHITSETIESTCNVFEDARAIDDLQEPDSRSDLDDLE
jgi:hypothetical protein